MSGTAELGALAARIRAIDWNGDQDRTRSRVALMREYLRRAALWTRALDAKGWPFYDIAGFAAPGVRADEGMVRSVLEAPAVADRDPTVGRTCAWALHLAAARDAGVPLPNLPDPFEPLIRMYERGGGFSLSSTGTIDIDGAGLYRGTLLEHLGDEPRAPGSDAELDALDGIAPARTGAGATTAPGRTGHTVTAAPGNGGGGGRVRSGADSITAPLVSAEDPVYPSAAYAVSVPGEAAAPSPEAPTVPAARATAQPAAPGAPTTMPLVPGYPQPHPQPGAYPYGGYPGYPVPGQGIPIRVPKLAHPALWDPGNPSVGRVEPGRRFLARFIDTVLAGALWFLLMLLTTFTAVILGGGDIEERSADLAFRIGAIFSFALSPILWEWFQVAVWGRSAGKVVLGLWVVRAEGGGRLPAGRALLRALCFAPGFTNPVNWLLPWSWANVLWSLRDKELRRCLHDRFSRSVVVQVG